MSFESVSIAPLRLHEDEAQAIQDSDVNILAMFDLSALPDIRRRHQTARTTKAVRRPQDRESSLDASSPSSKKASPRQEIMQKMHAVLREYSQDSAVGSGLTRSARWTGSTALKLSGNAANARVVAGSRAVTVEMTYIQCAYRY
jgi:hypothetical protein